MCVISISLVCIPQSKVFKRTIRPYWGQLRDWLHDEQQKGRIRVMVYTASDRGWNPQDVIKRLFKDINPMVLYREAMKTVSFNAKGHPSYKKNLDAFRPSRVVLVDDKPNNCEPSTNQLTCKPWTGGVCVCVCVCHVCIALPCVCLRACLLFCLVAIIFHSSNEGAWGLWRTNLWRRGASAKTTFMVLNLPV